MHALTTRCAQFTIRLIVGPRNGSASSPRARRGASVGPRGLLLTIAAAGCVLLGAPGVSSGSTPAPVNNLAPEVTGSPQVGERLVCASGSWSGFVSGFTYEWVREGIGIASGVAYTATTADRGYLLWCVVTAIGSGSSATAQSANSVLIPGSKTATRPHDEVLPQVSGQPSVGATLSCSSGTWSGTPAPSFAYQWVRDEAIVVGAATNTYTVAGADAGHSLSCQVTAANSAGKETVLSNSVSVSASKPVDERLPQVLGAESSTVGESLSCSPGKWSEDPAPTFSYRWVRDTGLPGEAPIEGATGSGYTIQPADQLHSLSCWVTATNSAGSTEAASSNAIKVRGNAPEGTGAPSLAGEPLVGMTLTCNTGTWTGTPTPTFTFSWVRDHGMPGEQVIGSASTNAYEVLAEDKGHSLSCDVTATNIEGQSSQLSGPVVVPSEVPGNEAPKDLTAPTVSGVAVVGETLTCANGTWSGTPPPTVSYQWLRDGSPIASATTSTYKIAIADAEHALACEVTAVNEQGVATASSGALEVSGQPPQDVEAPLVSGTPAVGERLTCQRGKWNGAPAPAFSYQWLRGEANIPSATAQTYTVASEDGGKSISCRVTAKNNAGTVEVISSNSVEIPGLQPQNTSAPTVAGNAVVGEALTCTPGTWSGQPTPTYAYQWLLDGIAIPAATASTFVVTTADPGLSLACEVTASNHEGNQSAISAPLHIPGAVPHGVEAPQVSGTPSVGQQLTCLRGIWTGKPPPAFGYRWLRDGTSIASASADTYTVELADQGHLLSCVVTATNSEGATEAESSNGLAIAAPLLKSESKVELSAPPPVVEPPTLTAAQILASLRVQLARAQHGARISLLRKTGAYAFRLIAPVAGHLEFSWYTVAPTTHSSNTHGNSSTGRPIALAASVTNFAGATAKTVKLRLTSAGRQLVGSSSRITLTAKAVFARPGARSVTWLETAVVSH
jgi:hypothetical protein